MTSRPDTYDVPKAKTDALRALFDARGHTPRRLPQNKYVAFEVRTDGRSIFTLYTSGKLVVSQREGDAEGLVLADEVRTLLGVRPATRATAPRAAKTSAPGPGDVAPRTLLAGCDETGTGELLGTTFLGGALLRPAVVEAAHVLAGHVETKSSRALSGWETLGEQLSALRTDGLVVEALCVRNPLFDAYSKNDLLDLAYVRLVGDLLASAGLREAALDDVELVIDDYGAKSLLRRAAESWRARGARVALETKADVNHLSARVASVYARSARAREMSGLLAEVEDGPIGTGNAGNPVTLRWVRRRARGGAPWPAFVKASFRTVRDLDGLDPVTKRPVPAPEALFDAASAADFVAARLDVTRARLRAGDALLPSVQLDARGRPRDLPGECPALDLLALLFGGLVLDDDLPLPLLDRMLVREDGLASGQRVLVGPEPDRDDPRLLALLRAHRAGIVELVPTTERDLAERARAHSSLRVTTGECDGFFLRVVG
ncbi:MAG: hypothetical protein H6825_12575 [Planctomycetes bacterium]|nr:hypothetical protein [Planctomycetota bacterium]